MILQIWSRGQVSGGFARCRRHNYKTVWTGFCVLHHYAQRPVTSDLVNQRISSQLTALVVPPLPHRHGHEVASGSASALYCCVPGKRVSSESFN